MTLAIHGLFQPTASSMNPKFLHIFNLSSQVNASAAVDPVTHLL